MRPASLPHFLAGLALLATLPFFAHAQAGGVRIGTAGAPDASAVLDLSPDATSAPKGFLPPRLSQTQRDAIASPAAGLTVFNTTSGVLNTWDGSKWVAALTDNSPGATFAYTGGAQTFTVPAGVTALLVDMAGAQGGPEYVSGATFARGGRVQATLTVTPGQVLTIYVGGEGKYNRPGASGGGAGYNGGGTVTTTNASGGGGATDIRTGGATLADRILVAGGAGGSGYNVLGGAGGGLIGGTGNSTGTGTGGTGGTQAAGGTGGAPGAPGQGGSTNTSSYYGAGGGGYYGGGSGSGNGSNDDSGGGGGSSYAGPGTSSVVHTPNYQAGPGYVRLLYTSLAAAYVAAPVLDGSNITGVIKNQTSQQANADFNVSGSGTVGGTLSAGSLSAGSVNVSGSGTVGGTLSAGTLNAGNEVVVDATQANTGTLSGGLRLGGGGSGEGLASKRSTGGNFRGLDFYTSSLNRLSISGTGNVGIGITSPGQLLELGGRAAPTLLLHSTGNGLMTGATLQFRENDLTYGWNLRHNNGGSEGGTTDDRLVLESTNGVTATPVMTWHQGSGNVGIGTTTPAYPLDVTGDARITGNLNLGFVTVSNTVTVPATSAFVITMPCPAGTYLLGGGGGYRPFGVAAQVNVNINYNGPDPDNPTTKWILSVYNNATTSRDVFIICNCARIR